MFRFTLFRIDCILCIKFLQLSSLSSSRYALLGVAAKDYDMVIDGNGGAAKAAFDFPERTRRVQIELESDTKRTDDSSIWSTVTLRETPTMEMFHLPGSIVTSVREELLKKTKNKNKQYQENKMKKSLMQNRDRSVQTFHNAQKVSRSIILYGIVLNLC